MPILRRCERCGAELALGALAELCPQCLLWSAAQGSTADQSGPTHAGMDSSTFAGEADGEAPRVEGYVPIAPLGRGGMGVVWRALQVGTRREVALKLLRPDVVHSDRARRRFAREVELAARLEHPNIARVYD